MIIRKLILPTLLILYVAILASAQKNGNNLLYKNNRVASKTDYIIRHKNGVEMGDSTLYTTEYLNKYGYLSQFIQNNDSSQLITEYGLKFDTLPVQLYTYSLPAKRTMRKEFFLHDKKGNIIETYSYRQKKKVLRSKLKYDKQNRKLEAKYYFEGQLKYTSSYKYSNQEHKEVIRTIYEKYSNPSSLPGADNVLTKYYSSGKLDSSIIVDLNNGFIEKSTYQKRTEGGLEITNINRNPAHPYFHSSEFPPFVKRDTKTSMIKKWFDKNGLIVRKEESHDGKLHWSNRYYYTYFEEEVRR